MVNNNWQITNLNPLTDIKNGMDILLKNSNLQPRKFIMSYSVYHRLLAFERYYQYINYLLNKSNFLMKLIIKFKSRKYREKK